MKVLVTGANSLLGTNVTLSLLAKGYKVRALVRQTNDVIDRVEVIRADINDDRALRLAMEGCSAVIHIAAITSQELLHIEDYRFNWECAERVARMADEMSLERMIYVSSANSIGNGTRLSPAREDQLISKPYSDSLYARSKVIAETAVTAAFSRVIIINPGFMIGPYDSKPSSGAIITRAQGHLVVFAPSGGKSFVHVADVATAIVNALQAGEFSQRYLATGSSMSVREFYKLMKKVTGARFMTVTIPSPLLIGTGYIGDLLRLMGIKTTLSSTNMRILCQMEYYDNSKIVSELGMSQTPISNAIKDAVKWFTQRDRQGQSTM